MLRKIFLEKDSLTFRTDRNPIKGSKVFIEVFNLYTGFFSSLRSVRMGLTTVLQRLFILYVKRDIYNIA